MKNSNFLVHKVGTGEHPPPSPHLSPVPSLTARKGQLFGRGYNNLINDEISPPHLCIVHMFHHIYGQFQGKFCFGRSYTKVGIGVRFPVETKSKHLLKKSMAPRTLLVASKVAPVIPNLISPHMATIHSTNHCTIPCTPPITLPSTNISIKFK